MQASQEKPAVKPIALRCHREVGEGEVRLVLEPALGPELWFEIQSHRLAAFARRLATVPDEKRG